MTYRVVEAVADGQRLDAWLAGFEDALSRSRCQALIKQGHVRVNGDAVKPNRILREGETVSLEVPEPESVSILPEPIPLDILYEDAALIVINKAPGLVVHPAPGHPRGTLVNALLHHCKDLGGIGGELRPGIVHRLDKGTSGAMVVAKTETCLQALQAQFKAREVDKRYLALAWGRPKPSEGHIDAPIGRSRHDRKKMSVNGSGAREARSDYRVIESFADCALLEVAIHTGRTHQVRVHCTHIGHPLLGDPVYGRPRKSLPLAVGRQMLHARSLTFIHPVSGDSLRLEAPLPDDMEELLGLLRRGEPS